ncbi:MAG: hypothetical protein P8101_04985 [Candidatus Thiodiazotropha sp.]
MTRVSEMDVASSRRVRAWTLLGLFLAGVLLTLGVRAEGDPRLGDVEFRGASIGDAVRILAELSGKNIIVTREAEKQVKEGVYLFLHDAHLLGVIDSICRITGLWHRRNPDTDVHILMTDEQFRQDLVVYRHEATRVFNLKHQNVVSAANAVQALFGERVNLQEPVDDNSYPFDGDMSSSESNSANVRITSSRSSNRKTTVFDDDERLQGDVTRVKEISYDVGKNLRPEVRYEAQDLTGSIKAAPFQLTYNRLHNLLLVRSSDEKALDDIAALIQALDRPARQVLLQMKILKLSLGNDDRSVFDFQYTNGSSEGPDTGMGVNPLGGSSLPELAMGLGNNALEASNFIFQLARGNWIWRLQLFESQNKVEVLSTPLLMASNNKEAELFIGEERPIVEGVSTSGGEVTESGTTTPLVVESQINKQKVGTLLKIWPRINSDETLTLDVEQQISRVNPGAASIPVTGSGGTVMEFNIDTVSTTTLELTAIAKSGQTIAVGGLIEREKSHEVSKIPLIGDIPGLGRLFTREQEGGDRSELVILIKPFIYDQAWLADKSTEEIQRELLSEESEAAFAGILDEHTPGETVPASRKVDALAGELRRAIRALESQPVDALSLRWRVGDLAVRSRRVWQDKGLFVTEVWVRNLGLMPSSLQGDLLGNYWQGVAWPVTDRKQRLEADETARAYLISPRNLEDTLERQGIELSYELRE